MMTGELDRTDIVRDTHEEMSHKGTIPVYPEIQKKYYWPGLQKTIENIIKKCELCKRINRKRNNEPVYIETRRPLEKFAVDIVSIDQDEAPILVGIDYFTRFVYAQEMKNKETHTVVGVLKEWFEE